MKKVFVFLLCLSLLLAGCRKQAPAETTMPTVPTTAPTTAPATEPATEPTETEPPVPNTLGATALTDRTYVVICTLDRDAEVEIVAEFMEDFYVLKLEEGYGLMEKRLVRPEGEAPYEGWTGYTRYQAKVYTNYLLLPGDEQTFGTNTQLKVLDDLDGVLVVQNGDSVGYMRSAELSRSYIQSTPSGGSNSGGADGGDIVLGGTGGVFGLSSFAPQEGDVTGKGIVLANGAEVILGWFDRGEALSIIDEDGFLEEKEGWYGIYHEGLYGYARQMLVRMDTDEAYAQWEGFSKYQAKLFDNYSLIGEPVRSLSSNTQLQILEDLGHCYLASDGENTGYIPKDMVSDRYINYSSGNSGSSGGDWTPPAM